MTSSGCILLLTTATVASSASILDFLHWGLEYAGEAKSGPSEGQPLQQCSCEGPSCKCCINFNMTYVDLGGPGCATMKYISQSEGVQVNVSYGSSQLYSEHVKAGADPAPTCVDLVYDLAQICHKFRSLQPTDTGLRGCATLQPTLLGETQADYPLGCFTMAPDLMTHEQQSDNYTVSPGGEEVALNGTGGEQLSEEVIAAFNESAEEGISWFSQLLGLSFGRDNSTEAPPPPQQQQQHEQQQKPHIVVAQSGVEQPPAP